MGITTGKFFCFIAGILPFCGGTSTNPPPAFAVPSSKGLDLVNSLIGNGGDTPNGSGGTIPSTAPPFGMTRWVAQTQPHYVSATPFNWTLNKVMGVVGTRQPAIWMGESAPISVSAGVGPDVVVNFEKRGLEVIRGTDGEKKEVVSAGYYSVELDDGHNGRIQLEQTASTCGMPYYSCSFLIHSLASRVAHLRFTFKTPLSPRILFEVARPSVLTSTPTNISFPLGGISIKTPLEICGWSDERQDSIIAPISIAPFSKHFKGYVCARFNEGLPHPSYGVIQNETLSYLVSLPVVAQGSLLSTYALFPSKEGGETVITLRVGTSFISEEQARKNIDEEIPDPSSTFIESQDKHLISGTFENTAYRVRKSWADIINRIELDVYADGRTEPSDTRAHVDEQTFWTAVVHTLQVGSSDLPEFSQD